MASAVIYSPRYSDHESQTRPGPQDTSARDAFATHFQHLRDDALPEMERIENMLTRVVIAYGLEYCHLDLLAKSFLALSRDVRRLLVETRKAVLRDDRNSNQLVAAERSAAQSLEGFRNVITSDLTSEDSTPVYRRLIATLLKFESSLSHNVAPRVSTDARVMQS
jgi:hypothetical protein